MVNTLPYDPLHPSTPMVLSLLALLPLAYLYTSHASSTIFPTLTGSRILLLTAHPDDETMFFAPTVQALTRPELGNHLKILCLSDGGKDGLGTRRRKELQAACESLGVGQGDAMCLNDTGLQDGDAWSTEYIRDLLLRTFAPSHSSPATASSHAPNPSTSRVSKHAPAETSIDALVTFDATGVSSHPNHKSCHAAATAFHDALMDAHQGWDAPLAMYSLRSVNILRKYSGILDVFVTVLFSFIRIALRREKPRTCSGRTGASAGQLQSNGRGRPASSLIFVAGPVEWWNGIGAMVGGHWSQMVWFRWGWVSVGRYMVVNDLRRIR